MKHQFSISESNVCEPQAKLIARHSVCTIKMCEATTSCIIPRTSQKNLLYSSKGAQNFYYL